MVPAGGITTMKSSNLAEAQEYLTVNDGYGQRKILDLVMLARVHPYREILSFLKQYYHERETMLQRLIITNRSSIELDRTVSCLFRVQMAINQIEICQEETTHVHHTKAKAKY
jgi:hypothetical protein